MTSPAVHPPTGALDRFLSLCHASDVAVLSKALKSLVKIERPKEMCEELGLCGDLGMPSTHSQIMAFAYVSMLLQVSTASLLSTASIAVDSVYCAFQNLTTAARCPFGHWSPLSSPMHQLTGDSFRRRSRQARAGGNRSGLRWTHSSSFAWRAW